MTVTLHVCCPHCRVTYTAEMPGYTIIKYGSKYPVESLGPDPELSWSLASDDIYSFINDDSLVSADVILVIET